MKKVEARRRALRAALVALDIALAREPATRLFGEDYWQLTPGAQAKIDREVEGLRGEWAKESGDGKQA